MPRGNLQRSAQSTVCSGMLLLCSGILLRQLGIDSTNREMRGWVLLRGRQCGVDALRKQQLPDKLRGRNVCEGLELDSERHVSSGPLLSGGVIGPRPVSPRHELFIHWTNERIRLSVLYEGLLLSVEWYSDGYTTMSGGILLSQRHSKLERRSALSDRSVLSIRKCGSSQLCSRVLPR